MDSAADSYVLSKVKGFCQNFSALHPRSPLLLTSALNEDGVRKPVMSYITPTLLPFISFLELESATRTFHDLLDVTPSDSEQLPTRIFSPAKIMEAQRGNALECALLLASILAGSDYSAFVVQGEALECDVINDTSLQDCPHEPPTEQEFEAPPRPPSSKYRVISPSSLESRFDATRRKIEDEGRPPRTSTEINRQTRGENQVPSTRSKTCLHFWVLVLPPNRHVSEPVFIDLPTAKVTKARESNSTYKRIHSVFNHSNFFGCCKFHLEAGNVSYELWDKNSWFPLWKYSDGNSSLKEIPDHVRSSSPSEIIFEGERSVGWTKPIILSEEVLNLRFPRGQRKEIYRNAISEKFAPLRHPKGVVLSVCRTAEDGKKDPKAWTIFEIYENRKDNLMRRIQTLNGDTRDVFDKSRSDGLKAYRLSSASSRSPCDDTGEEKSLLKEECYEFYHQFRADGLKSLFIEVSSGTKNLKDPLAIYSAKGEMWRLRKRWRERLPLFQKKEGGEGRTLDQNVSKENVELTWKIPVKGNEGEKKEEGRGRLCEEENKGQNVNKRDSEKRNLREICEKKENTEDMLVKKETQDEKETIIVEETDVGKTHKETKEKNVVTEEDIQAENKIEISTPQESISNQEPGAEIPEGEKNSRLLEILRSHNMNQTEDPKKSSCDVVEKVVLISLYVGRKDRLVKRKTVFDSVENFLDEKKPLNECIERIEEDFEKINDKPGAKKTIQRHIFDLVSKTLVIIYRYQDDRILRRTHSFLLPNDQRPESLEKDKVHSFEPDPKIKDTSLEELRKIMKKQLEEKQKVEQEILKAVKEVRSISVRRKEEEENIELVSGIFRFDHNNTLLLLMRKDEEEFAKREEREKKRRQEKKGIVDSLSPYLHLMTDPNSFNEKEQVKERCLEDFAERLEIRANLLQDRLDKSRGNILELREELSGRRRRLTPEERNSLTEQLLKAEAEHRRLRTFLSTWRSEAAHRYEALEAKLEAQFDQKVQEHFAGCEAGIKELKL